MNITIIIFKVIQHESGACDDSLGPKHTCSEGHHGNV